MKMPVIYHEECIKEAKRQLKEKEEAVVKLEKANEHLRGVIVLREQQCEIARSHGVATFDYVFFAISEEEYAKIEESMKI